MPRFTKSATADLERFGRALRAVRVEQSLSQAELARALGLRSQSTVAGWEAGTTEPEREHVFRMEDVLNQPAGKLAAFLGYGPPAFVDGKPRRPVPMPNVRRAVQADESLSKSGKEALLGMYRALTSPSRCTVRLPLEAA